MLDMQYESTSVSSMEFVTVKVKDGDARRTVRRVEKGRVVQAKESIGRKERS